MLVNARRVVSTTGSPGMILLAIEDVARRLERRASGDASYHGHAGRGGGTRRDDAKLAAAVAALAARTEQKRGE